MTAWVYLITNKVNGKQYVGITSRCVEVRFKEHLYQANKGRSSCLHAAMRKYGFEAFDVTTLTETETWDEAGRREVEVIAELGTKAPGGYNLTDGGDGSSGVKCSDETLRRRSEVHAGRRHTPETRRKISEAHRGKKTSEETKNKISKTLKGRCISTFSDETKAKMSAARRQWWQRKREAEAAE